MAPHAIEHSPAGVGRSLQSLTLPTELISKLCYLMKTASFRALFPPLTIFHFHSVLLSLLDYSTRMVCVSKQLISMVSSTPHCSLSLSSYDGSIVWALQKPLVRKELLRQPNPATHPLCKLSGGEPGAWINITFRYKTTWCLGFCKKGRQQHSVGKQLRGNWEFIACKGVIQS